MLLCWTSAKQSTANNTEIGRDNDWSKTQMNGAINPYQVKMEMRKRKESFNVPIREFQVGRSGLKRRMAFEFITT